VLGPDEVASGLATVRDMATGQESKVRIEQLAG
jgi:histidyl-tRNA synthetase